MGKVNFEASMDALGVGSGYDLAFIMHTLQTAIRYEPEEYSLFKSRRNEGLKDAIKEGKRYFVAPIDQASIKKQSK